MSPGRPPLSIVIPSRNTSSLTLACLASVAAAAASLGAPSGPEVVLVDDAGGDGTAEAVAARFPDVRIVRLSEPSGFTRAANRGMAAANGEVLLLLNSDTEVDRDGLAALVARFAAEPQLGIAGATLRYADGRPQWSGGGEPGTLWLFGLASGLPALLGRLPFYRRLRQPSGTAGVGAVAWVTGAAMAIRRSTWDAAGPLDERFVFYGQDLDLCLRACDAGWAVRVLPEFRVLHHHGATIGGEGGQSQAGGGAQHLELLWGDLVRWSAKRHGRRGGRRAAAALGAGGRLRRLGRVLWAPCVAARRRAAYQAESAALRRALAALRTMAAGETC